MAPLDSQWKDLYQTLDLNFYSILWLTKHFNIISFEPRKTLWAREFQITN